MARRISSSSYRSSTLLSQIASKQKLQARGIERQRREAFRRVNTAINNYNSAVLVFICQIAA